MQTYLYNLQIYQNSYILSMLKSIGTRYREARKRLGLTLREAEELSKVTNTSINKVELDKTESPNHKYTTFLIKQGINPYFLIGETDETDGLLKDAVSKKEYEKVLQKLQNSIPKTEYERILKEREEAFQKLQNSIPKAEYEKLLIKYETMQEAFKLMNTHQ